MITKFTKHFQAFWDSGVIGKRCSPLFGSWSSRRSEEALKPAWPALRAAWPAAGRRHAGAALLVIFVIVVVFVAISLRGDQTIWELGIGGSF
jgi:hypothetical protein